MISEELTNADKSYQQRDDGEKQKLSDGERRGDDRISFTRPSPTSGYFTTNWAERSRSWIP
jgi:hypothetical protein